MLRFFKISTLWKWLTKQNLNSGKSPSLKPKLAVDESFSFFKEETLNNQLYNVYSEELKNKTFKNIFRKWVTLFCIQGEIT